MRKNKKYAVGGVVTRQKFKCSHCGNIAWQSSIFIEKPICDVCKIYMDESSEGDCDYDKRRI